MNDQKKIRREYKHGFNYINEGECIVAWNNADFLNKLLGLSLKAYPKSSKEYKSDLIWMVYFDDVNRMGWRNFFLPEDECCQVNISHVTEWDGCDVRKSVVSNRVIFEITDLGGGLKEYSFRGVFEYEEGKSDPFDHVYYKKVADIFDFYTEG